MATKSVLVGLLLCAVCGLASAKDDPPCLNCTPESVRALAVTNDELLAFLRGEVYRRLDAFFQDLQSRYESGDITEHEVSAHLDVFQTADVKSEKFQAWLKSRPDSWIAYAATGIHYQYKGIEARGDRYSSKTPEENFQMMHAAFDAAEPYLLKAVAMTSKSAAIRPYLMQHYMYLGREEGVLEQYRLALKDDPKAFRARRVYMTYLTPRWSGHGIEDMQAFLADCVDAGLPAWQQGMLKSFIYREQRQQAKEARDFNEELRFATLENEASESDDSLAAVASAKMRVREGVAGAEWAEPELRRILIWDADRRVALDNLALLERARKNYETAIEMWTRSAQNGSAFAQYQLGYCALEGWGLPKDETEAVKWFRKAAANGSKQAGSKLQKMGLLSTDETYR